jgi:hypothetical protein
MPSTPVRADPVPSVNIDEVDNRTAKLLLFMPEALDGANNFESSDM